ncbi:MAG: hypothetical protein WCG85_02375 [Polyangia bacterium]
MSLTVVSFGAAVRIGGELDAGGLRGFVLLQATPSPALLTPRAARQVANTLLKFAAWARPARKTRNTRRTKGDNIMDKDTGRKAQDGS